MEHDILVDGLKGFETAADAYITKPFNMKLLKVRIGSLIGLRKQLWKSFSYNLNYHSCDAAIQTLDKRFIDKDREIINLDNR